MFCWRKISRASGEVSSCSSCSRECAQPGLHLVEIGVIVARMADELPRALGHAVGNRGEQRQIEHACDQHAQRSVRGAKSVRLRPPAGSWSRSCAIRSVERTASIAGASAKCCSRAAAKPARKGCVLKEPCTPLLPAAEDEARRETYARACACRSVKAVPRPPGCAPSALLLLPQSRPQRACDETKRSTKSFKLSRNRQRPLAAFGCSKLATWLRRQQRLAIKQYHVATDAEVPAARLAKIAPAPLLRQKRASWP